MEKNKNGKYECEKCGKEFDRAGSCTLHEYRKHNYKRGNGKNDEKENNHSSIEKGKGNIERNQETKTDLDNWVFLGKSELVIKNKKITLDMQKFLKEKGHMEINKKTGDLR